MKTIQRSGSIRRRFIIATVLLALVMLVLAVYAQRLFNDSVNTAQAFNDRQYAVRKLLDSLKAPLRGVETVVYRYGLTLDPTLEWLLEDHLVWAKNQLAALLEDPITQKSPALMDEAHSLVDSVASLDRVTHRLMHVMGKAELRYPGMSLLTDHLVPLNKAFQSAMQEALDAAKRERSNDPRQQEVFELLTDLRHYWALKISAFRIYVANRSGVFGEPAEAMSRAQSDRASYASEVAQLLSRLSTLDRQGLLNFEQAEALDSMRQVDQEREKWATKAMKIYASPNWRADLPLLEKLLQPLVDQTWGTLSQYETLLEKDVARFDQQARAKFGTLSRLIWLFAGLIYVLLLVAYYMIEYAIRRPMVQVARAMEAEARDGSMVALSPTHILETDLLIDAFTQMQHQVRSRQQRIESILRNAGEGIVTLDANGTIESFNLAAERIFGYQTEEACGMCFIMLLVHLDSDILQRDPRAFLRGVRELSGVRKGGEVFPMDLSLSEMTLDDRHLFIGVFRDTTERKQAEERLHQAISATEAASAELASKNLELVKSLDDLKQAQAQLVESEKMASLGGLVAGVAHEINTPVGIGVTAASHLQESVRQLEDSFSRGALKKSQLQEFMGRARESADIILSNLQRAAGLVQSFKQVAVDQTMDSRRRFDFRGYLEEILLSLRPTLKKTIHRVEILLTEEVEVDSYPGALSQIVTNLIMNSLKHAFPEGHEGMMVLEGRVQGNDLMLIYRDNGTGIPSEHLKQIFEPFFTTKRGEGGSGLGLHLVYNIVTQHLGGSIRCESSEGKGATFIMQLRDCVTAVRPIEEAGPVMAPNDHM